MPYLVVSALLSFGSALVHQMVGPVPVVVIGYIWAVVFFLVFLDGDTSSEPPKS